MNKPQLLTNQNQGLELTVLQMFLYNYIQYVCVCVCKNICNACW